MVDPSQGPEQAQACIYIYRYIHIYVYVYTYMLYSVYPFVPIY